jgi:hypothetical protein
MRRAAILGCAAAFQPSQVDTSTSQSQPFNPASPEAGLSALAVFEKVPGEQSYSLDSCLEGG